MTLLTCMHSVVLMNAIVDFSTDNSQITSFSGFSTQDDSVSGFHTVDFSSTSSVWTPELSDFQRNIDSDIRSPEERDPNSNVGGNRQNRQMTDNQLSETSATSEADFWSEHLEDVEISDFDEGNGASSHATLKEVHSSVLG